VGKPYTIKFGSWSPDLQNVGVEMPFQWSETELPSADTLNVFYQDAAYRCLPGPSPFASSLGTPVLDAFTWYDNTAGKEIVFLATANGFFILEDGAYTPVPTQVNVGALGLALSIALGSTGVVNVWLTPSSQSATNDTGSYTFGNVAANSNGSPSAYNWTFSGVSGSGSWSIASGQGTANAVPEVTGAGGSNSATLNCAMTIGGVSYTSSSTLSYTLSAPVQHTYSSGSGTETAPYTGTVTIEEWAPGGGGANGNVIVESGLPHDFPGGSGGAGGYCRSSYAVTAGQTLLYSIGTPGAGGSGSSYAAGSTATSCSVSSGTLSITTMTANGGQGAPSATGGSGGSATGGNQANTTGATGPSSSTVGSGGTSGVYSGAHGGGGGGNNGDTGSGQTGGGGFVSFYYSY
jgi:hypothetical protein